MNFLEKDLEQIIYETDIDVLRARRLFINENRLRQKRLGNYGICDLIAYTIVRGSESNFLQCQDRSCIDCKNKTCNKISSLDIQVFELKKEKVNIDTFIQGITYCKAIIRFFEKRNTNIPININLILIGKQVSKSRFVYLADLLDLSEYVDNNSDSKLSFSLSLMEYSYDINGLQFKDIHGYKLIDEGF